jgi:predicted metal-dependent hydrolase
MQYTLIRARKRTLSLQVGKGGEIIARAPYLMPKFLIDRFVEEKSGWIIKRQAELQKVHPPKYEYFQVDELKKYIEQETQKYADLMGLYPTGLRFTQVNSYWGTCAPSGILSFNLSLRYTPKEAVSYVVVHELSHLKWKGHGQRFWAMVEKYYPRTKEMRKLLRQIPRSL